jgi:short-subunit dehydrogenase
MNNAGITHRSLFTDTKIEVLRKVMEVNFWGSVYCTKYALPYLLQSQGMIVVTSSIAGFTPLYGRTGYSASKYALHGFFESLRSEVAPKGVKVLMVCPGFTDTGIASRALDGDGSVTRRQWSTTGKIARPEEVAQAVQKAIEAEKRLLVLSTVGKAAYWIGKLFPKFYENRMRASVIHEFES